jgi:hypothetical protein
VWEDYKRWRRTILSLLSDLIDREVMEWVRANPPRCFGDDNLSWIDDAISAAKRVARPDIGSTLASRLKERYGFVRAFHGCRPEINASYTEHGLLPCNPAQLAQTALRLFSNRDRVQSAIDDLSKPDGQDSYQDYNRGKVFFCLEMEHLVEDCGHYMLYGSEYLLAVANRVGEPEVLRRRGRATVIECDVPIPDIPMEDVRGLAGEILREIFERFCDRSYKPETLGFAFHISVRLAPENIVGFHFPTKILNPHNFPMRED